MKFSYTLYFLIISNILTSCTSPSTEPENVVVDAPKASSGCTYSRNEKDPLGKQIRIVSEEKFFGFQFEDSATRAYFKGNDFIKGYLSCVNVDSVFGVYFEFKIYSDDAYRTYGGIKKDNKIVFILKSGKGVELTFGRTFSGSTNLTEEFTEYSSFAPLSKSDAAKLKSEELHRVKISWGKRDEDYAVVNPNVFINQIPCIE